MTTTEIAIMRPAPAAVIKGWRPVSKGSLRGFCDVEFPRLGFVYCNVVVHESRDRRWAYPAGIPQLENDRRHRLDPNKLDKLAYNASIKFTRQDTRERWQRAVLEAIADAGNKPWLEEAQT